MALQDLINSFRAGMGGNNTQNPNQQNQNNTGTPGNIPAHLTQPGASSTLADGTTAPNGVIPENTNKDEMKSPLDQFTDLWKNDPNDNTKTDQPLFNLTAENLKKAAATQDFRGSITKEQLTAIAKGGQEAVEAFASAMNNVAQDIYMRSAVASTKLIESAVGRNNEKLTNQFSNQIRSSAFSESMKAENPAFSHPAAQPLIGALESQMALKFPQATSSELRSLATDYLKNFADAINAPTKQAEASKQSEGEVDWSSFLE